MVLSGRRLFGSVTAANRDRPARRAPQDVTRMQMAPPQCTEMKAARPCRSASAASIALRTWRRTREWPAHGKNER